ncbi:TetR/AcrR family transcriptional regulator [Olsenella sp. HMSC062G07]|uniref:TetR/AcrR family transcriptional regulator n=1 Tax=Olsenella sp. HMSC062G07 TaxID=1739330 RepID=UPI0008A64DE8|nr:TetR/AcrR family transcriptional regulator [Olsenella sp. HMSC062G07]OFK24580.1 hypothetical protein HMPREF2826_06690 [Olsenella sp. HMSC062G07]
MGILNDRDVAIDIGRGVRRVRAAREGVTTAVQDRLRARAKTRKSAATRERIMAAAGELMSEHNGTDFQMSEVSARCRLSKGSLYYYFSDKDALVEAIFDREVDELVARVESAVADAPSALTSIRGLVGVLASSMLPQSPLALAVTRELIGARKAVLPAVESRLTRIIDIFEAQVDRAKVEGLARSDIDSRLCAVSIAGAFTFGIFEGSAGKDGGQRASLPDQLVDLLVCGMGSKAAIEGFKADKARRTGGAGAALV